MRLSFFIPCNPPKATGNNTKQVGYNHRAGRAFMFDSEKSQSIKAMMFALLRPHRPSMPLEGPLKLGVVFVFPFNKADMSTKAKRAALELNGYVWHDSKPDLDNLRKILNDTMEKLCFFRNDSQIVIDHGVKVRGKKTGICIDLLEITGENNRNAFAGMNIQILFKNSIVDHPAIINGMPGTGI